MMLRWAIAGMLCLGLSVAAQPALAQSCNFTISNLIFSSVNLAANTSFTTTATYSASCTGTANTTVRTCPNIDVGSGGSTSGDPRFLVNGTTQLNFKSLSGRRLFLGLGLQSLGFRRILCVADDRCPPSTAAAAAAASQTLFGRISAGQPTLPAGLYSSSFTGAQTSIAYAYSTVGTCATIGTSHATPPHSRRRQRTRRFAR